MKYLILSLLVTPLISPPFAYADLGEADVAVPQSYNLNSQKSSVTQAGTIYLLLKSKLQGKGVSLVAIPMVSKEKCEEEGVRVTLSKRFDLRFANQDAFECVNGK